MTRSDALPNQTPADQVLLHAPANQLPKIGCCQARWQPNSTNQCQCWYLVVISTTRIMCSLILESIWLLQHYVMKILRLSKKKNVDKLSTFLVCMLRINKWCSFLSEETISINQETLSHHTMIFLAHPVLSSACASASVTSNFASGFTLPIDQEIPQRELSHHATSKVWAELVLTNAAFGSGLAKEV